MDAQSIINKIKMLIGNWKPSHERITKLEKKKKHSDTSEQYAVSDVLIYLQVCWDASI